MENILYKINKLNGIPNYGIDIYGNVYNLSGERASLRSVAEQLIQCVGQGGLELVPFPEERKKIDIGDFYGDSSKLQQDSGWTPKVSLKDGLKEMVDFYKVNKNYYLE